MQGFTETSSNCYIKNEYLDLFRSMSLTDFNSFENYNGGTDLVKASLDSFRRRVRFTCDENGQTFFLKYYTRPPIGKQIKNWLNHREIRSMSFSDMGPVDELNSAGINIPEVVAFGEDFGCLFEKRSFIVTAKILGEALERKLPSCFESREHYNNNERIAFIVKLADFARRFHKTGYRHRDFYLAHIFWSIDNGFYLIDLFRAFKPCMSERYRIKDIAQLYYSCPSSVFTRVEKLRFYKNYAEVEKLKTKDKNFIRKVIKKAVKMARHDKKRDRTVPFEN